MAEGDRLTTSFRVVAIWVVIATGSCLGQDKVESITDVLSRAGASGSIAYWSPSGCRPGPFRYPEFPKLVPASYSGSLLDTLREMFANDPKMSITQEPGGIVRMRERDVPTDILDVKIHHLSFNGQVIGNDVFHGPIMAMRSILMAPEVQDFARERSIRPIFLDRIPGNAAYGKRAQGELGDVTVSQALDYLLHTFPGYWIYGNCTNETGSREVFFWFIENT